MYLSKKIILACFASFRRLSDTPEGKQRAERLSGLRYFLATAELTKSEGKKKVDISAGEQELRQRFIRAVGHVVALDDDGAYSNNFYDQFDKDPKFRASSNFLTTQLKKDRPYPGRPAPLIECESEKVSIFRDAEENLLQYGDWNGYRVHLAVWLNRFEDFGSSKDSAVLARKVVELNVGAEFRPLRPT